MTWKFETTTQEEADDLDRRVDAIAAQYEDTEQQELIDYLHFWRIELPRLMREDEGDGGNNMTDDLHSGWTFVDKDEENVTGRYRGESTTIVRSDTAYMRVPGGRIYRLREYSGEAEIAIGMVFVPITDEENSK